MSHIELYKKYRPNTWDGLIGQEKVAQSLRAAIVKDKTPTAYGFFGERGCGKTSAAFLLAKALNCTNMGPKGDPCNSCEFCVAIDKNAQVGVNYISMANKGSVEDVRQIVNDARLSQPLKKQVWILDEVHNLSKSGFDALLIPLEDTKMDALFIICSTELGKIPDTILSRIQSRKFTLVAEKQMRDHLKHIAELEGMTVTEDDYDTAIRQGRGSVRGTLSALEAVLETGESAPSFGGELILSLADKNISKAYEVIAEATSNGVDGRDLAEQLHEDLRNLLLRSVGVSAELVGVVPVKEPDLVIKKLLGERGIILAIQDLGDAITRMSMGEDSRIQIEVGVVNIISKLKKLHKALLDRKTAAAAS